MEHELSLYSWLCHDLTMLDWEGTWQMEGRVPAGPYQNERDKSREGE
jgi:hypothetical protein